MVCLALELVGPWVVPGFSVGMEAFFWVLVLKDLVGLHKIIQLQLLQHYWLGHRLGLL